MDTRGRGFRIGPRWGGGGFRIAKIKALSDFDGGKDGWIQEG
jgi:hypothetical protein